MARWPMNFSYVTGRRFQLEAERRGTIETSSFSTGFPLTLQGGELRLPAPSKGPR
jgi:hypothetical protein